MRLFMTLFYLLLILFGISFAVLNAASVPVNFYFITLTIPISALIIIALGIGLLLGSFLFLCRYWVLKVEHLRIKNQLKLTEKEIKNLRSIPLKDQH